MSRNRIIYQSLGLFVSQVSATGMQTAAGSIKQLTRAQSFDTDFSRNLTDVNQYGNLAAIDRLDTESPTVNASLSYFLTDGGNEKYLGFTVATGSQPLISCLSGILSKATDEKNLYLLVASEGADASSYVGATSGVIGVGNAFITSYSLTAAIGDIPTASVDFEALGWRVYADADGTNNVPAVNPSNGLSITNAQFILPQHQTNAYGTQPSALLPGDVTVTVTGTIGASASDLKVQSAEISFDLSRTPQNKLGSRYAFSREIDFPVTATLNLEAEVGDLQDGNLSDLLCLTGTYDLSLAMKRNSCSGDGAISLIAILKGARLISQNLTTSIGANASLTATYEVQLSGPEDVSRGVFLSGTYQ